MAITITAVRPLMVAGSRVAVGGTASVDDALALQLVQNGDATATFPTTPNAPDNYTVVQAGVHAWAGGAATTDSISVPGIKAGDIIECTLVDRASTETLVLAKHDVANGQIDLTLSANGTNATTKIAYKVSRPL
jgi:hypothetical protein